MNKEELVLKWLNNDLSTEELEAFKQLDEYPSYVKLSGKAGLFYAPEFDLEASLQNIQQEIQKKKRPFPFFTYVASIAAVLVIGFLIFNFFGTSTALTSYETLTAEVKNISLPDQSSVSLNSNTILSFDEESWEATRDLTLEGEALFKVQKGETFTVNTSYGDVKVLGTIFNVKSRDYAFQVTCFEGTVQVSVIDEKYILNQNDKLVLENNKLVLENEYKSIPNWKENISIVKNKSLDYVLEELKNYYKLDFNTSSINTSQRFTGSFSHVNINLALNSITLPLGLTYEIDGETVIFTNK